MDNRLTSKEPLTQLLLSKEIFSWNEAIKFIQNIPYGRNESRTDFSLVISENKGTCSSKHALLKEIAIQNHIPNVQLIIGLYKMNQQNTPKIGSILSDNQLTFIPEAHCYLKINDDYLDITSKEAEFDAIKNVILEEIEIEPYQVGDFKIEYHQNYLKDWMSKNEISFSFDQIWEIREKCIENISA